MSVLVLDTPAEPLSSLIEEQLATKRDLKELEERLTYRLTLRLGSMVAAVGIIAALLKVL